MKVLVAEKISDQGLDILKKNVETDIKTGLTQEEVMDIIDQYDALIVRSATKVTKEMLQKGKNLKVVGRAGTGVDNIDINTATELGITVVNTPASNNVSAAEHTIGLMLACARNIQQAGVCIKNGKWERNRFKGVELFNKTVAILGLGRIGSLVAERLKAFGMHVIGFDPYVKDDRFEKMNVERVSTIDEVMERADFITIHLPKTEDTVGIIGEKELKKAKKTLRIVNCARGGLIDETALYNALKNNQIAGAAIDVLVKEPKEGTDDKLNRSPLLDLDNLVITPHLGASTVEAQNNVGTAIAQKIVDVLNGKSVETVNCPKK